MLSKQDSTFLKWFINRLVFRYCVDPIESNFEKFRSIVEDLQHPKPIAITSQQLDQIICKYYADFNLDKSEIMGFTQEERDKLRKQIIDLVNDIINTSIPKNYELFIDN